MKKDHENEESDLKIEVEQRGEVLGRKTATSTARAIIFVCYFKLMFKKRAVVIKHAVLPQEAHLEKGFIGTLSAQNGPPTC